MGFLGDLVKVGQTSFAKSAGGLAAGAAGSALSSLFGGNAEKRAYNYQVQLQDRQNAWQAEQNQKAMDWSADQWRKQFDATNAYNSPSAQIQRMIEAGMNPASLTDSGNTSASVSTPGGQASGASVGAIGPNIVGAGIASNQNVLQAITALSQSNNLDASSESTRATIDATVKNILSDASLKDTQTALNNTLNDIQSRFGGKKMQAEITQLGEQTANTIADTFKKFAETNDLRTLQQLHDAMINTEWMKQNDLFAHAQLTHQQRSYLEMQCDWFNQYMKGQIDLMYSQRAANLGAADASHASAAESRARVNSGLYEAQTDYLKSQNRFISNEADINQVKADLFAGRNGDKAAQKLAQKAILASLVAYSKDNRLKEAQRKKLESEVEKLSKETSWIDWNNGLNSVEQMYRILKGPLSSSNGLEIK